MTDHLTHQHAGSAPVLIPGLDDDPLPVSSSERGRRLTAELEAFVEAEGFARTARTRARYRQVLATLLTYLDEADLTPYLGTIELDLLDDERRREPSGSFLRLLSLDEVVCCLPGFLVPPWVPHAPGLRRTHVSLVDRLLRHLRIARLVDLGRVACALYEAEDAVQRARHPSAGGRADEWPDAMRWRPSGTARPGLRIVGDPQW